MTDELRQAVREVLDELLADTGVIDALWAQLSLRIPPTGSALAAIEAVIHEWDRCMMRIERHGRDLDALDAELVIKGDIEDQLRDLMTPDLVRILLRIPREP